MADEVVGIPVGAAFGSVPVTFLAADGDDEVPEFELVAYSGRVLRLEYPAGAEMVIDLEGASVAPGERPLMLYGDREKPAGQGEIRIEGGQVLMSGMLNGPDAVVEEIIEPAIRGFTWRAIVNATLAELEFVREGETVKVNGERLEGPGYVARRSQFYAVSLVALGGEVDGDADLQILAAASPGLSRACYDAWLAAKAKPASRPRLRDGWLAEATGRGSAANADLDIFFEAWLRAKDIEPSELRASERRVLMAEWSRETAILEARHKREQAAEQIEVQDEPEEPSDDDEDDIEADADDSLEDETDEDLDDETGDDALDDEELDEDGDEEE